MSDESCGRYNRGGEIKFKSKILRCLCEYSDVSILLKGNKIITGADVVA